jgi:hypothetical protein
MTDPTPSIIKGGYVVLSAEGMRTRHAPVLSADEASSIWRAFVEDNDLGASDLKHDSGFIYSNDRKLVAKVSYNGRVWTPNGELLQESPEAKTTELKVITASLEGMRVLVDEKQCELQEYNFRSDKWQSKEILSWPLPRDVADQWLTYWNAVDRFAALRLLTEPECEYVTPVRKEGGDTRPRASFRCAHTPEQ